MDKLGDWAGEGGIIQPPSPSIKLNESMTTIRERDLRGVDLNLLVTLLVLLRERSVSKAAQCLHLGQPAVSGALSRLRELFKDELLVRAPGGMRPTARGSELQTQLLPLVSGLQAVLLEHPSFDAATSERRFVVGMMDWVNTWLLPGLLSRLAAEAPGVRLTVVATDRFRFTDMLQQEEMDLAVGPFSGDARWQRNTPITTMHSCCVARAGVLGDLQKFDVERFASLPHVMVSYRGATSGVVDQALALHGMRRNIVCTVPTFSSLLVALRRIPSVATVPRVLADLWQEDDGFDVAEMPVALPPNEVTVVTHRSRDSDPGIQWLCELIKQVAQPLP